MFLLWRVLSTLTLGGVSGDDIARLPLSPGSLYQLKVVSARSDAPFCIAVVEESIPVRALALGCYPPGKTAMLDFHERPIAGALGKFYTVVVFSKAGAPADAVLVTTEIEKVRNP